jgi:hypothetical protein
MAPSITRSTTGRAATTPTTCSSTCRTICNEWSARGGHCSAPPTNLSGQARARWAGLIGERVQNQGEREQSTQNQSE